MPDSAQATPRFDRNWIRHAAMLAGVWAVLLLLFRSDALDLAKIYWTNTTFGHCLFIAPVVAWLVWQRREGLAQLRPQGWLPGLVLLLGGGFAWLVGDASSVALARHLGLVVMLIGSVVAVLGPNVARGLLFPLCYMLFLVPFGDFLEEPLQQVTASIVVPLLQLFNVPAVVDGVLITTPNGYFEIAEACSGAKFLIAMVAYGVLVSHVCYISWGRRAAFMVMAMIVPIIANGFRAFGTIYAAWLTSVEQATGMDHIVYGWIFFALVMVIVLALGWRWFDRDPDAAWFDPAKLQGTPSFRIDASIASLLCLCVASLALVWASVVASRAATLPSVIEMPVVSGWERANLSPRAAWSPNYPGADHKLFGRYVDDKGHAVDLAVAVYANQHEGKEVVGFGIGAIRENDRWVRIANLPSIAGGASLRMVGPARVERVVATWYRVGDTLTGSGTKVKLATLKGKLLGGSQAAVALVISAEQTDTRDASASIQAFLDAIGPLDILADQMSGAN